MKTEAPIILFDGECNLCNWSVSFILAHDSEKRIMFCPLQSDAGKTIISEYKLPADTDSIILLNDSQLFIESDAVLETIKLLPLKISWLKVLYVIPKKLRDSVYRFIARNRYKVFGKRQTCRIPTNDEKARFIKTFEL